MARVEALAALALLAACAPPESPPPFLQNGAITARGNEPFWAIAVTGHEAIIRTPELLDGVPYKDGRWTSAATAGTTSWTYKARRKTAEGLWITLEVRDEPCTDSMSGESFPRHAFLTMDGRRMEGCAT